MTAVAIIFGLVLLYLGGELLVRGSVAVARALGVSPLVIGITLVGFGTSTPELVTSIDAAISGAPGIAIGNVVGSNLANILLILGIAMVMGPIACAPRAFARDVSAVVLSGVVVVGLAAIGRVDRWVGLLLLVALAGYLFVAVRQERTAAMTADPRPAPAAVASNGNVWLNLLFAAGGIASVIAGAHLLVNGSIDLARLLGIPETVIGLTVVAIGTSLPELATSITAALRRQNDIVLGNVLGSSVFNVFGILGATALIHPLPVPPEIFRLDAWVLLATTIVLAVFALTGRQLTRKEGGLLVAAYIVYIAYLVAGVFA